MADKTTPYLAPNLKDQGYTGATGSTPYKPPTATQQTTLQDLSTNSAVAGVPRTVATGATVLNINFDGTQNNKEFPNKANGEVQTNVGQLTDLQTKANGKENTIYLSGVGAQTAPSDTKDQWGNPAPGSSTSNWDSLPSNAGKVANGILLDAYQQLSDRIVEIRRTDPDAPISINLSGFSRGGAEAVAFANLLNERGLPGFPPGQVPIDTMVLFDPVAQTNGQLNTSWPANVRSSLVMVAMDEGRAIMPAMPVGESARVVAVPGAHCDIGGSFDPKGISAVTLGLAREFQDRSGNRVAPIPQDLTPDPNHFNVHNSGLDNYGNVKWSFDENGKRFYEGSGLGSGTVQDALNGKVPQADGTGKVIPGAIEFPVPADPAKPDGAQLRVREVRDETGALHLEVRDANGQLVLESRPGEQVSRDATTGKLTVADSDGHEIGSYTAPAQADTFTAFLTTGPGSHLSPAQQDALAAQLDNLGLGGGNDLSFHTLPDGSVVIANKDGERVGEIQIASNGDVRLTANSVESDGTAGQHDVVIAGDTTTGTTTAVADTGTDTTPVTHREVEIGGVTYTLNDNGTLDRTIPGGLVESRDSTGAGIIFDRDGNTVAILQPGDRVGLTDDGRIAISDDAGHGVDRTTEDAPAGTFATPTPTPDGSDAHLTHYPPPETGSTDTGSTTNPPVALVDTGTTAPETVATTGNPTSTPIDTSGPDGSDAHFNNHPPTLDVAGLTADLTFASTLLGLKNWGSQDDLGHLSTLVSLYNQGTAIAGVAGSAGPLGDLGSFGAGLGVISALKSGNPISVASSGASFYNSIVGANSANAIPVPVINALNLVNAIQSGNPISIASSAVAFIPGYGPLLSIGISLIGSLFGSNSPPPPPDGVVHYTWDDSGAIAIQTDHNVSGGGDTAKGTAGGILGMLQSVVDNQNDHNHAQGLGSSDNLALDPTRLPKVGFTAGMSWIEVTHADGTTTKETIDPSQLGERLLQVAVANDAVVPQWQVQTMQAHHQAQLQEARIAAQQSAQEHAQEVANASAVEIDGHGPSTAAAPSTNTAQDIDGHAPAPNTSGQGAASHGPDTSAQGIAGKATESADHKSQTYDALVVHLGNPTAQAHISAIAAAHEANATKADNHATAHNAAQGASTEVLRDIDGDGYFENTQWVDATDANGNAQGMLVLDANVNGTIETADILHLGGNAAERNSMAWLDANGDGKLDASDPAFAAIKLWVDVNHNGRMDAGESTGLQSIQLTSIDLNHGTLNYADGQSDQLSTTTLSADTEGVKLDTVKVVGADGKLKELDAGELIVHEQYDGKTRTISYELQAKVTGDWEGTAEQEQHRHGGGNVAGAPTQTHATGATSVGAVVGKTNVTTATTMDVGDKRITSDAPATSATTTSKPTTITVKAGDARITSDTPAQKPVTFVPAGARDGWITEDGKELLQLPQDSLFGANGLGALTAVALGAVQQTAFAHTEPGDTGFTWQTGASDAAASAATGEVIHLENFAVVRQIHLGATRTGVQPLPDAQPAYPRPYLHPANLPEPNAPRLYLHPANLPSADMGQTSTPRLYLHPANQGEPNSPRPYLHPAESTPTTLYIAPRAPLPTVDDPTPATPDNGTPPPSSVTPPTTGTTDPTPPGNTFTLPPITTPTNPAVNTNATASDDRLADPQEDVVLRVSVVALLANDTNAATISQVGNARHGTVSLQGGEVVFTPEANYHGPASFAYIVTGQDGSQAAGLASFNIEAVNDVPVARGETANATEDVAATITQATLLANDTDPDVATDGQTLRVSAVGHASHGTVNILGNGSIQFTPDANFHGTASFDYQVNDGHGGTATATATVQVAAVNDVPVALGETIASSEDTTLLLDQAALLANDTDADMATDGQVLTISAVSNATHGTVSILGNGQIQFVPVANYSGTATFDYVVSDGHGGTATATATVLVGSTDDAPVASGETVASQEDQTVTLTAAALLANDTDVDNAASDLRISRVAAGTGGTVTLNASGNVVFTPTANFNGTATFTYWVKDPDGLESNAATVTLNVAPVNDSPYAQGEVVNGASEDAVFNIARGILLANDGDEEDANNMLGLAWVGNAVNGTVALDSNGDVVFTPAANFNGTATFDYQVRDSAGAVSPTVTAQIPVAAVNDNPVAADESFTMYTNTATTPSVTNIGFNQLLANDTDIDNPHAELTVSGVRNANNGTVAIVGGLVQFTPTQDFNGTASFEYQVNDQHGGTTWATAFVNVAPPPNQYASINVTYANFYPTGSTPAGAFDIGDVNWTIVDDGNAGLASVTFLGGTYHVFGDSGPGRSSIPWNIFTTTQTSWYIDIPRSSALDGFDTTWRVVDDRGLQNIWHFGYTAGSGVRSSMDFSGWAPPVVLGLDGNTPQYIETSQSKVRFDLNGDGVAEQVAWAAPGSGVLGIDLNGDHQISNANEFTFTQYTPGAKTDLEGLRAFDTNHNGVLDTADAQWGKFGVWEDKNSDGRTQEGEYQSLDQLGIASINLSSDKDTHAPVQVPSTQGDGHLSGVAVMGESSYTHTDGRTGVVHDAMFAFDADRELAEARRMALQFNQFCNTAQGDHAPLGFVPIAADDHSMAMPWVDGVGANAHQGVRHEDIFS